MNRKLPDASLLVTLLCITSFICFLSCTNQQPAESATTSPPADSSGTLPVTSPAPVDSGANAYGIDVSKYQGNIVSDIINKDGLSFVICKATEGETYTDPDFANNWEAIRKKNLRRGAYHFYHSDDDPVKQAQFFVQTLQGLANTDISPILDIEGGGINGSISVVNLQNDLLQFLTQVEQQSKRRPVIYTGLDFANKYLSNSVFTRYPLWIAEYSGNARPELPQVWKEKGYIIWQRSPAYTIDSDTTDFDVFNGNKGSLYRFIQDN
jgi:lysozyme